MNYIDTVVCELRESPINIDLFLNLLGKQSRQFEDVQLEFELLLLNGFPLDIINDDIVYKPTVTNIENQEFCIVDIETTAGKVSIGQIIEIGAIKYKNGKIIDTFDQLVYCKEISEQIENITNISTQMVANAPKLQSVLEDFKSFLSDCTFVAHATIFDYKFINDSFEKYSLGKLANPKICTIDLAKRIIKSEKYGLSFLKEHLNIDIQEHHRAFSDARSCLEIFKVCLDGLPKNVTTTDDLMIYSTSNNIIKKRSS